MTHRVIPIPPLRPSARSAGHSEDLLVAAGGFFLVALAYSLGRAHSIWAYPLFWVTQAVVFGFLFYRLYATTALSLPRAFSLSLAYAAFQYAARWAYSPDQFRFSDELQHLRSAQNALEHATLFTPNYALPISPEFPGMENVTAELAQLSGLGVFWCGIIVIGAARLLLAASLVLLFHEVARSPRLAAAGALIFLVNPNGAYFDSSFLYESLALPFVVLALYLAVRWSDLPRQRIGSALLFVVCTATVVVTHHVSAVALCVILILLALGTLLVKGARPGLYLLAAGAVALLLLTGWVLLVAQSTVDYLDGAFLDIASALGQVGGAAAPDQIGSALTPVPEIVLAAVSVVMSVALLPFAWLRTRAETPLRRAWVFVSGTYVLVLAVRVFAGNGAELATRGWTFVYIPTALALAYGLAEVAQRLSRLSWDPIYLRRPVLVLVGSFIFVGGGLVIGIPPSWERIPGTFHLEGPRSGIDAQGVETATWSDGHLLTGARFVGDLSAEGLNAGYAQLDPVRNPRAVFYSTGFTRADAQTIRSSAVRYIYVDARLSQQIPLGGRYFPTDIYTDRHTAPIDPRAVNKFDGIAGLSRIYDNGTTRIYDVRGSAYAP